MFVVGAQRRGGAAQAAVGQTLDRVDTQSVRHESFWKRYRRRHAVHATKRHYVDAGGQSTCVVHRAVDRQQLRRDAAIRTRGDPQRQLMAQRRHDHRFVVVGRRRRHHAIDQTHRGLVEQTRGLAVLVTFDHAARRSHGRRADAGARECRAVRGIDVPAGPRQDDRPVRRRAIQVVTRRRTPLVEQRFVVAAAQQPAVGGQRLGEPRNRIHQRRNARHASQIEHRRQQMADLPDVGVCVVESRDQRAPGKIDPLQNAWRASQQIGGIAHRGDASAANQNGRRRGERRLRQHTAVVENDVAVAARGHAEAPASC